MFSASDPIRGGSEWRLPWQVLAELIEQCGVTEIKEDKMFSTVLPSGSNNGPGL
ncbi:hypothetical protein OEZ86_010276 [Tetradesmus obliquus]|nr:hypothetical protein OEZ86_010276 [Tetradesmus obliquus]